MRDELAAVEVAGETYFSVRPEPGEPDGPAGTAATAPAVLLLPLFDELPLAYRELAFPPAPGHPHPPDADVRTGSVVSGDANVGTWGREVRGRAVEVSLDLAPGVFDQVRTDAQEEARRLAVLLGRDLELR